MSVLELRPSIDPKRGECVGSYLYGSGYFAREDQQMAIVRGERTEASFCNECPLKRRCETEHSQRVKAQHPEEVEAFEREVAVAKSRGFTRLMVQAARMKGGNADPFLAAALANYHRGVKDKERANVV